MRIGVSLRSSHDVDDPRVGARWMIERAAAAERAGLDHLFVGDHHVTAPRTYYQNTPMLGRLLAEWGERPAGALFLLPMWHPVLAAEQVATLAAIARGRFVLQCAIGGDETQFRGMGADLRTRARVFESTLDAVRRLLAGEEMSSHGLDVVFEAARIAPLPSEPVEVWIGGHADAAIDRAARLGDGWLAGPAPVPDEASALARTYLDACDRHGRSPSVVGIRRDVYVGSSDTDVAAATDAVVAGGHRGFDPAALVRGTVEQVAEAFRDLAAMGYTDVVVRNLTTDPAAAVACLERLAEVRTLVADA